MPRHIDAHAHAHTRYRRPHTYTRTHRRVVSRKGDLKVQLLLCHYCQHRKRSKSTGRCDTDTQTQQATDGTAKKKLHIAEIDTALLEAVPTAVVGSLDGFEKY